MSQKATILYEAEFNPKIKTYLNTIGILVCVITVVGIFLLPLWLIFASFYFKRYFERLECELTTRALRFKKGYIFHTERTIPLDKIQDLTFKEGPVLKYFGLSILKVETAGGNTQTGSDLSLIGIQSASEFRQMVLDQRDKVTDNVSSSNSDTESTAELLKDIRDSLQRIEAKIN
ncbi:PH domain-containing protein [Gracilimonas mengyeensis]|uniref:Putative membrane protein n=1 Tax=Gracilimonas mengyeensis TaxID=1302730 RepID=A0A521D593_9BACT|nr:PH domain-containing protein [Gracilimonas mengyeensis]SMO66866.1 putative membrane protein [Gracilimonas mengyeensis]